MRETIGYIRDGVFRPGETYRLRTRSAKLQEELNELRAKLNAQLQTGLDVVKSAKQVKQKVVTAIKTAGLD